MRTYSRGIAVAAVAVLGIAMVTPRTVNAATDTANATATIIAAINITKTVDLDFASIVPDTVATGTLVVSPASAKTCAGNLVCTGTVAAASFDVTGGLNTTYAITLPGSILINNGGFNMTVDSFTSNPTVAAGGDLTTGSEALTVGATLTVGTSQAVGTYSNTFDVTVNYN